MSVTQDWPLQFGIFLAPFHPVGQNPTLALERDLEDVVAGAAQPVGDRGAARK